jgi:hypothetical protein
MRHDGKGVFSGLSAEIRVIRRSMTAKPISELMTGGGQEEYTALRATIGQRGTARVWMFLVAISGWAALYIATVALALPPVESIAPLVVLAAGFEAVYAIHVGVERIGRYLQVFYENRAGDASTLTPAWERTAMTFGRPRATAWAGTDPLFAIVFVLAGVLNVFAANLPAATREEFIVVAAAHGLFFVRVASARVSASKQRANDLARFEQLKSAVSRPSSNTTS